MRILFDPGVYDLRNNGNNAMLQASMGRLRDFWPGASLNVVTVAPHLSRLYFPDAHPVDPDSLDRIHDRFDNLHQILPRSIWWMLLELRQALWHRWPSLSKGQMRQIRRSWVSNSRDAGNYSDPGSEVIEPHSDHEIQHQKTMREAVSNYDLIVYTGGGYLVDAMKDQLADLFNRIEAAAEQNIPVVMVGQGVGPMEDPELLSRAREVLPKVDLLFYRAKGGRPLLDSLGVPAERVMLTGDDAIEIAYQARSSSLGTGIGVSLRVTFYTQIEKYHIDQVRLVIHGAAKEYQAQLIAVPVSSSHQESDLTYIKQVLAGYSNISTGWRRLETPLDVIKKAQRCRIMITGTYHGAIFALAQGIPVVGLASSSLYKSKLSWLTDEFGPGCQVLFLDDKDLPDKLMGAIHHAWDSAEQVRPILLQNAALQIEAQQTAYKRIYELVTSRHKETYE